MWFYNAIILSTSVRARRFSLNSYSCGLKIEMPSTDTHRSKSKAAAKQIVKLLSSFSLEDMQTPASRQTQDYDMDDFAERSMVSSHHDQLITISDDDEPIITSSNDTTRSHNPGPRMEYVMSGALESANSSPVPESTESPQIDNSSQVLPGVTSSMVEEKPS